MSRFYRLIGVEGGRVAGTFVVLLPPDESRAAWVMAHDVTIYGDDAHTWGRVAYSNDLKGSVRGGVATLSKHMINQGIFADVEDVWDEMLAVLVEVVDAAIAARDTAGGR